MKLVTKLNIMLETTLSNIGMPPSPASGSVVDSTKPRKSNVIGPSGHPYMIRNKVLEYMINHAKTQKPMEN